LISVETGGHAKAWLASVEAHRFTPTWNADVASSSFEHTPHAAIPRRSIQEDRASLLIDSEDLDTRSWLRGVTVGGGRHTTLTVESNPTLHPGPRCFAKTRFPVAVPEFWLLS